MDLQLRDKVAIVTGASRGIGRAIAYTLLDEGMKVVVAARTREPLEAFEQTAGGRGCAHVADLREPDAPGGMVAAAVERFGAVDLLVNNAGATKRGDFLAFTDADWMDGFALKFFGAMRACRAAWPHLRASRGAIVNIVGVGGRTGAAGFGIGGAVNAALLNWTKVMADRGVEDGVRVNAINPGGIATERLITRVRLFADEHGLDLTDAQVQMAKSMGVARFGEPVEIARLVAFLGSPVAGFCHGSVVDADGGQTRTL